MLRHRVAGKVAGNALVKAGNKNWYFLTADYAFGASLEADASTVVKAMAVPWWAPSSTR